MSELQDPKEAQRLMELGRVFQALMMELANVERGYLAKFDKTGTRTPRDIRDAALKSLDWLEAAFDRAWDNLSDTEKFDGFFLPWPLLMVQEEIDGVNRGSTSAALTTDGANKRSLNKESRFRVHERTLAVAILNALVNRYGWSKDAAAEEIAAIFTEMRVTAGGTPTPLAEKTHKDRRISAQTIINWGYKFGKNSNHAKVLAAHEKNYVNPKVEELSRLYFKVRDVKLVSRETPSGIRYGELTIEREIAHDHPRLNEEKAKALLAMLRDYLRGTSYKVPEKEPEE